MTAMPQLDLAGPQGHAEMSIPHHGTKIFLCGDVMTGRGIDQILPHPSDPRLYESAMDSAVDYVRLAEMENGPIARPTSFSYVWGAALDELSRRKPDARIINLETSITRSEAYVPKGINYRMSPENAECLSAAGIDCCMLANNHVLDWSQAGLLETLDTLARLKVKTAGAGRDLAEAKAPAVLGLGGKARLLVFAFASITSGVPRDWAARPHAPGINLLQDLTLHSAACVAEEVAKVKQTHDIIVASIHWGSNWGYDIPDDQRRFAHELVDKAGLSILYGHSSHHAKGMEIYRNRLILYGCGDFLNDYEGIRGYEVFRADLALMYFADIDVTSGDLLDLEMVPLQIRRFRLERASVEDVAWLAEVLDRESRRFATQIDVRPDGMLVAQSRGAATPPSAPIVRS